MLAVNLRGKWRNKYWRAEPCSLALIFLLVCLFYRLNFGLKESKTTVNTKVETFRSMKAELDLDSDLYLYLEKDSSLFSRRMELGLRGELQDAGWQVRSFSRLKDDFDGPVLALKLL